VNMLIHEELDTSCVDSSTFFFIRSSFFDLSTRSANYFIGELLPSSSPIKWVDIDVKTTKEPASVVSNHVKRELIGTEEVVREK
jgi:hypothetical protein